MNQFIERKIITGMIVSDRYMRECDLMLTNIHLLESPLIKKIVEWCKDYYKSHGKSPGKDIEIIYDSKVRDGLNEEQADSIGDILSEISEEFEKGEYKDLNTDFLLDETEKYFKKRSLEILAEDMKIALEGDDLETAEKRFNDFKRVERVTGVCVNPLSDPEVIRAAFEEPPEPLIKFPGALGEMLNHEMVRDSLVGILAPEKRGKTWWMIEFAMRALRAHKKVAFFEVGDMSRDQFVRRIHTYIQRRNYLSRYCGKFLMPIMDCHHNQIDKCDNPERSCFIGLYESKNQKMSYKEASALGYLPCTFCAKDREFSKEYKGAHWFKYVETKPFTWGEALKAGKDFETTICGPHNFRLSVHSSDTLTVEGMNAQLENWYSLDDFSPDVIIGDYADILAASNSYVETRHQENHKWKGLRRMSQDWHSLVITASQADADSYDKKILSLKNFSEDKRKYAHVTMMIALNQTPEEKREGIMRISQLLVRESDFDMKRTVKVLQCLNNGRPFLGSYW